MGERSPHNNPNARGTFIGMTMDTTRADMTQAVLEGVAFALRDSFEVAKSLGIKIERTKICGDELIFFCLCYFINPSAGKRLLPMANMQVLRKWPIRSLRLLTLLNRILNLRPDIMPDMISSDRFIRHAKSCLILYNN